MFSGGKSCSGGSTTWKSFSGVGEIRKELIKVQVWYATVIFEELDILAVSVRLHAECLAVVVNEYKKK